MSMPSKTVALLAVLLVACAGAQRNGITDLHELKDSPGVYLGHSQTGTVVMATSHFAAMNGVAVSSSELGVPGGKGQGNDMLCTREVPTGTHVPHYVCRYSKDVAEGRLQLRDWFDQPRLLMSRLSAMPAIVAHGSRAHGPIAP